MPSPPVTEPAETKLNSVDGVTIDRTPVQVSTKLFDRDNPPGEMPSLRPGEAAVTESNFSCRTITSVVVLEQKQAANGKCYATVKVEKMTVTLGLDVVIWLPEHGPRKLSTHEKGHQQISETYYESAGEIATALAAEQIGESFDGEAGTFDAAIRSAIAKAGNLVCQEYMSKVQAPAASVQERYDRLTDHGRNRLNETEAIRQSISQEREPKQASNATTSPTT